MRDTAGKKAAAASSTVRPVTRAAAPPQKVASAGGHRLSRLLKLGALLAFGTVAFPYVHCVAELASSANEYGGTLAAAERLRQRYPHHLDRVASFFKWLASSQNTYAETYFQQERLNMLEHLEKEFTLHPYFANPNMSTAEVTWHGLIHARMKDFRQQLEATGRRDFDMEKDRCAMYSFYARHGLPTLAVHGVWHSLDALLADVHDGRAYGNVSDWPIFWKACHLTQSSSYATRSMNARPLPGGETEELAGWLKSKWDFRANDYERVWVEDGNVITRDIPPGFLLQAPFKGARYQTVGRVSVGLPEVRVEVLWGRPYLALLDGVMVLMRNGGAQDFGSLSAFGGTPPVLTDHWFFTEGHDACVWDVAGRAANAAGVDSIRIDIFLDRSEPSHCILNENSLSSGMAYWGHEKFMAQLWSEPHVKKLYRLRETSTGVLEQ